MRADFESTSRTDADAPRPERPARLPSHRRRRRSGRLACVAP